MQSLLNNTNPPVVEQHYRTPIVPYAMLIITTQFDLASSVLYALQALFPSVLEAVADVTRRKADGCLIVDVPLPDLESVEMLLDTMPGDVIIDYIPVQFE